MVSRILPHESDRLFMTDGGLETTMVFHEGFDLPGFASFVLMYDERGRNALEEYFRAYMDIAKSVGAPLIIETVTWRANPDWMRKIGYADEDVERVNRDSVLHLDSLRGEFESSGEPLIISGCIGPRGDGYVTGKMMSSTEAKSYHLPQIKALADAGADLVSAITMTYEEEAIGIADAAADAGVPAVISFTVETDGRLPSGSRLSNAIAKVDAESNVQPAYYMINCAHPSHFVEALKEGSGWQERILGTRVNASKQGHAELDESEELDEGNPSELAEDLCAVWDLLPNFRVSGGCCGTDDRHVREMARKAAVR